MRASLETGGVPITLKYRPQRPRRPEIFVLCDVSTSVTSASTFFLSVLHALHDAFRKLRSFVFIERISEVTEVFERERDFRAASEAISKDAGVADISGYTDYGRVWEEFLVEIEDELHPRATVIVLGDARTNGRPPRDDVFAAITARAGRAFALIPVLGRMDVGTLTRAGLVLFFAGSVGAASSWSLPALIVFRCVQGAGAAMLLAGSFALLSALAGSQKRGLAVWVAAG